MRRCREEMPVRLGPPRARAEKNTSAAQKVPACTPTTKRMVRAVSNRALLDCRYCDLLPSVKKYVIHGCLASRFVFVGVHSWFEEHESDSRDRSATAERICRRR